MLRQYELVERVLSYDPDADEAMLNRAYVYTVQKHGSQKRASGDPYFSHPVEVAGLMTELQLDQETIITALLHDTVEDTLTSIEDLEGRFGSEVARLVDGVTKLSKIEAQTENERAAENLRKFLLAISDDIRVLLVKLADRLHNMRTLHFIKSPEKRRRIAKETMDELCDMRRDFPERVRRLVLRPLKGGFHEIVDGAASFLAAMELGLPNVCAYLVRIDEATAARLALRLHAPFGRALSNSEKWSWVNCALDRAPDLAAAIMSGELTLRAAGRALGVNKDTIRKVLKKRVGKGAGLIGCASSPAVARVHGLTPCLNESDRIADLHKIGAVAVRAASKTASPQAVLRDVAQLADRCLDFLARELVDQRKDLSRHLPELLNLRKEAAAEQQAYEANREAEICRFARNSGCTVVEAERVLHEQDLHGIAQIEERPAVPFRQA